jgi:energy-coupling factor transport system ATP-binding protein
VAAFADRLVILSHGQIALENTPRDLFPQVEWLNALGTAVPQMTHVAVTLNQQLGTDHDFLTVEQARAALAVQIG